MKAVRKLNSQWCTFVLCTLFLSTFSPSAYGTPKGKEGKYPLSRWFEKKPSQKTSGNRSSAKSPSQESSESPGDPSASEKEGYQKDSELQDTDLQNTGHNNSRKKGEVLDLVLIDPIRNAPIKTLGNVEEIALSDLPAGSFSIEAKTSPDISRVIFEVNKNPKFRIESVAPFFLVGDNKGMPKAYVPRPGEYQIRAVPYRKEGDRWREGSSKAVVLRILPSAIQEKEYQEANKSAQEYGPDNPSARSLSASQEQELPLKNPEQESLPSTEDPLLSRIEEVLAARARAKTEIIAPSSPSKEELSTETQTDQKEEEVPSEGVAQSTPLSPSSQTSGSQVEHIVLPSAKEPILTGLTLLDARKGTPLLPLAPYQEINLSTLSSPRLTVRAELVGQPEKVVFHLNDMKNFRIERAAPYLLAGDKGGSYGTWSPKVGEYTITAETYAPSIQSTEGYRTSSLTVKIKFIAKEQKPLRAPTPTQRAPEEPAHLDEATLESLGVIAGGAATLEPQEAEVVIEPSPSPKPLLQTPKPQSKEEMIQAEERLLRHRKTYTRLQKVKKREEEQ